MQNYLYTLPNCTGCEKAKQILKDKNLSYEEVLITNPALELGVMQIFKGHIYAPFFMQINEGVFIFSDNNLQKIKFGD